MTFFRPRYATQEVKKSMKKTNHFWETVEKLQALKTGAIPSRVFRYCMPYQSDLIDLEMFHSASSSIRQV